MGREKQHRNMHLHIYTVYNYMSADLRCMNRKEKKKITYVFWLLLSIPGQFSSSRFAVLGQSDRSVGHLPLHT